MEMLKSSRHYLLIVILTVTVCSADFALQYEAENLNGKIECGRVIKDKNASNKKCRASYINEHKAGHMMFGPYATYAPGYYLAAFRLKGVNTISSINPIALIDVVSGRIVKFSNHAKRPVYASDFNKIRDWQEFTVGFYLGDTTNDLQFRVEWFDSIDLYVDNVVVTRLSDPDNFVFAVNLQDLNLDLKFDQFDTLMIDKRLLLASIQGGVNRNQSKLVLLHNYTDYEGQGIYRWLHALNIPYALLTYDECLRMMLDQKIFKGCVYLDPGHLDMQAVNDPPENQRLLLQLKAIATNLASTNSLIIVTPRTVKDINLDKFPIIYDLTNYTAFPFLPDSTGAKALQFNIDLLKKRAFNKDLIIKLFPYTSSSPLRNAAEKLTDFAIQNGYWCFYADLRDTIDNSFFLDPAISDIHYLMGWSDEGTNKDGLYYNKEYEHIKLASQAGKLWIGDMNRIHNLSFFAQLPAGDRYAQQKPSIPPLKKKIYISFLSMDGDNPVLQLQHYRKDWDSPLRGEIPESWGMPPKLLDLAPSIINHYYITTTKNDCMLADISGLAWHLTNLFDFNDFPDMLGITAKYLEKLDIRIVKLMGDRNNDLIDVAYLQKFVEAYPDILGFVEGYFPPSEQGFMMVKEKYPSVRLAVNRPLQYQGDSPTIDSLVAAIKNIIDTTVKRPLFLPVIYNIYNSGFTLNETVFNHLKKIQERLAILSDDIVYVRQDVMIALIKKYYEKSNKGKNLLGNGGFENSLNNWSTSGDVLPDSESMHTGHSSIKVKTGSFIKQMFKVDQNKQYRCKLWVKPDAFSCGSYVIKWHLPDIIHTDTVFIYQSKGQVNNWLFYFRDLKPPSNAKYAEAYCDCIKGLMMFDDVAVQSVSW